MALRTIVHLFWIWLVGLKSSQRTGCAVRLCFFVLDIFPTHWLALQLKYSDISRFAAGTISAFSSILQHPSIGTCWSHNGTSSDRLSNKIKVHDPSDDKSEGDWERRCHLRTNSFKFLWCKWQTIELSKSLFLPLWVTQYSDWPMHRSCQTHCNRQAHASTSDKHHLQIPTGLRFQSPNHVDFGAKLVPWRHGCCQLHWISSLVVKRELSASLLFQFPKSFQSR